MRIQTLISIEADPKHPESLVITLKISQGNPPQNSQNSHVPKKGPTIFFEEFSSSNHQFFEGYVRLKSSRWVVVSLSLLVLVVLTSGIFRGSDAKPNVHPPKKSETLRSWVDY